MIEGSRPIRNRIVLFAPGFELMGAEQHRARYERTLARSATIWGFDAEVGSLRRGDSPGACFRARAAGPNWRTEAEIRLLAWDDLVRAELARKPAPRLRRGLRALGGVVAPGTMARYAAAHWRYALFAIWPLLLFGGAVLSGVVAGLALSAPAGVLTGAALGTLAWRGADLGFLLANWAFAQDLALGAHQARIAQFADEILAARRKRVDEVVVVGHSLGAVFAVQALAKALRSDPSPCPEGTHFVLIGLGSSVLKVALLPGATQLRADLAQLATTSGLAWIDYASRRDVLSFERTEPVGFLGLTGRGPRVESVHPRDMVDAATWARMRWNFLRLHRQYVMGNARRYFLDFGLLTCGPLPTGKGLRADRVLGPDGELPGPLLPRTAELAA